MTFEEALTAMKSGKKVNIDRHAFMLVTLEEGRTYYDYVDYIYSPKDTWLLFGITKDKKVKVDVLLSGNDILRNAWKIVD